MGIKVRNLDDYVLELSVPGTVTAATSKACGMVPFAGFIRNIYAALGTAGTGTTNTLIDVNKNGTTIFSATTTQLTLAATTGVLTVGAYTTDPTQVSAGDIITIDTDAVSTSPANLSVMVTISRIPPSATDKQSDHLLI